MLSPSRALWIVCLWPVCVLCAACGGRSPPATPTAPPAPRAVDVDERPTPARARTPQPAPAAEAPRRPTELLARRLQTAPIEALPKLITEADPTALGEILGALPARSPALGWASLRMGRLAAHRRHPAEAQRLLLKAVEIGGPSAARAQETLDRLNARERTTPGRIGVLLPLSGPYGDIGRVARAGVDLALSGRAGIELIYADTQGEAKRAPALVERLALVDHVAAILGPVGGIEGEAAARAAERLEVPMVSLSAAAGIPQIGTFIFRHRLTHAAQATAIARHACEEMGLRRFAILYPEVDYGREMMTAFWRAVERCGGQITDVASYGLHDKEFNEPVKRLVGRYYLSARQKDPRWESLNRKARDKALHVPPVVDFEAIFLPDLARRARMVLPYLPYWDVELRTDPAMRATQLARKYGGEPPQLVQVLGASGFNSPAFAQRVGRLGHNSVFVDDWWPDAPEAHSFVTRWTLDHPGPPPALAAHAFDAAHILAAAVSGQGTRAGVRRALLAIRDFEGVFGRTEVAGDGEMRFPVHVLTIHPEKGIVPFAGAWSESGERAVEVQDEDAPP